MRLTSKNFLTKK